MQDELIGKRVSFRTTIWGQTEGIVIGIHWEPTDTGLRPSMVANIQMENCRIATEYLHGLTVIAEPVNLRIGFTDWDGTVTVHCNECQEEHEVKPYDSGYYSSEVDFCEACGSGNVRQEPNLSKLYPVESN